MQQRNFNNYKHSLTDQDIEDIISVIGNRCRDKTKRRLKIMMEMATDSIPQYGILERLMWDEKSGWHYCAGQSYPDEIRTVRECILKG